MNTTQTICIIRHAEKPAEDGSVGGVSESGAADEHELSVRGWQRAGALTQFFGASAPKYPGLRRPDRLFAAAPGGAYHSRRNISTLTPLARLLGVRISEQFSKGDEFALAQHLQGVPGAILIAWEHKAIPTLAAHLADDGSRPPTVWPENRFDLVWMFAREGSSGARRFIQIPQLLLSGDESAVA